MIKKPHPLGFFVDDWKRLIAWISRDIRIVLMMCATLAASAPEKISSWAKFLSGLFHL